jgi:hypothetical protein
VGATPGSTNVYHLLTRLWTELSSDSQTRPPTDLNELKFSMDTVLKRVSQTLASKKPSSRLLILIDALNQMDTEGRCLCSKSVQFKVRCKQQQLLVLCARVLTCCRRRSLDDLVAAATTAQRTRDSKYARRRVSGCAEKQQCEARGDTCDSAER